MDQNRMKTNTAIHFNVLCRYNYVAEKTQLDRFKSVYKHQLSLNTVDPASSFLLGQVHKYGINDAMNYIFIF